MEQNFIRNIFFYKRYFLDFFNELTEGVQKKFNWTFELISTIDKVPKKYFQYMEDGIYEIRVEVGNNIFSPDSHRDSFFDEGQMIVVANAFQKKTQKTSRSEIELVKKIKKRYFDEKDSNKK